MKAYNGLWEDRYFTGCDSSLSHFTIQDAHLAKLNICLEKCSASASCGLFEEFRPACHRSCSLKSLFCIYFFFSETGPNFLHLCTSSITIDWFIFLTYNSLWFVWQRLSCKKKVWLQLWTIFPWHYTKTYRTISDTCEIISNYRYVHMCEQGKIHFQFIKQDGTYCAYACKRS